MSDTSLLNEPKLQDQVEKLNRQNTEHSHGKAKADNRRLDERGSGGRKEQAEPFLDGPDISVRHSEKRKKATKGKEDENEDIFEDSESEKEVEDGKVQDDWKKKDKEEAEASTKSEISPSIISDNCKTSLLPQERYF